TVRCSPIGWSTADSDHSPARLKLMIDETLRRGSNSKHILWRRFREPIGAVTTTGRVSVRSAPGGSVPLGVTRIRHAKLPVSDLQRSVAWYRALLDMELAAEFAEQGVVRGVQ